MDIYNFDNNVGFLLDILNVITENELQEMLDFKNVINFNERIRKNILQKHIKMKKNKRLASLVEKETNLLSEKF